MRGDDRGVCAAADFDFYSYLPVWLRQTGKIANGRIVIKKYKTFLSGALAIAHVLAGSTAAAGKLEAGTAGIVSARDKMQESAGQVLPCMEQEKTPPNNCWEV